MAAARWSAPRRWLRARATPDVLSGAALCALVALTWLPRTQGPLDLRWDSGAYYVLGTSLAEGKGYRLLNEPGEIEAIQYPPGLPALVAIHQVLLGTSDPHVVGRWLRLTFFVLTLAYTVAAFALLRRFLSVRLAGLGTLLCVLTPATLINHDALVAEVPFVLAVTLFAVFALRAGSAAPWLAALSAVAAYSFRTAGTAVLLAWVAESAVRRQWRRLAVRLVVAAIPVLAWQGHIARVERDPAYARPAYAYQRAPYLFNNVSYATNLRLKDPFLPALGTVSIPEAVWRSVRNLPSLPSALGEVVSVDRRSWEMVLALARLPSVAGRRVPALAVDSVLVGLGALALLGIVVLARRGEHLVSVLLLTTILAVCTTPWAGHWARYLSPVAPLVVLAAIHGALALHRGLAGALAARRTVDGYRVVAVGAALVLVVDLAALALTQREHHQRVEYGDHRGEPVAYRLYYYRDAYRAFDAGLDWLRQHAHPSDVVATTMPYWVYLRTGLRAVMPPAETDPEEALRLLDTVPTTYVVAGGSTAVTWGAQHLFPAVRRAPDRWAAIYAAPQGNLVIYERRPRAHGDGTR